MHPTHRTLIGGATAVFLAGVSFIMAVQPAAAATIAVTTTADDVTVNGNCTLREAVQAANTNTAVDACPAGSGADTITIPAGTYNLTSALAPTDTAGVEFVGEGAATTTLSASGTRIVQVGDGPFSARGLTFTGGNSGNQSGGAIFTTDDDVTITDAAFVGNQAFAGGAISTNLATVTTTRTRFANNSASGVNAFGGALNGGSGALVIDTSTFENNTAVNQGGAVVSVVGSIAITNSTFTANTAASGGAIYNSRGPTTITNSTIDANTATAVTPIPGAAVEANILGTLVLRNVTLTGTKTGAGLNSASTVELYNTIVADNEGGDCAPFAVTSHGGNLTSDGSCALTESTDLESTDPMLAPLASDVGLTEVRLPMVGSPVIDSGVDATCETTDQRGVSRPQDGDANGSSHCDRGAVEVAAIVDTPTSTTNPSTPTTTATGPAAVATQPRFAG